MLQHIPFKIILSDVDRANSNPVVGLESWVHWLDAYIFGFTTVYVINNDYEPVSIGAY